jgi:RNA polymerase sigma factor (TIGR02999 family)
MPEPYPADLTRLLNRMLQGDEASGNQAMNALYTSLRRIAGSKMRHERPGHLLDTGALVNEAMLRLFGTKTVTVQNRQHFFALVCLLMRRILVDYGRRKDPVFTSLEECMATLETPDRELMVTLDRILNTFGQLDPPAYKVFQLKVGAGMTNEEIADELSCGVGTVNRGLRRARTWMFKEMTPLVSHPSRS